MQRTLFFCLFTALASVAGAQSIGNAANLGAAATPAANQADLDWQAVQNKGQPHSADVGLAATPAQANAAQAQAIAADIADADSLKAFYTKNPSHPQATEAKRKEALALLFAASLGDTSQQARCKQLVTSLRKDPTIDIEHREQLAAFSDNLDVAAKHVAGADQQLLAYEQTARALQAEFPGSSSIYESLVGIAQSSADDHAAQVAHDLLGMPAPDGFKTQAQILLSRLALKGTSLATLASGALGAGNPIQRAAGNPVVVYTWSAATPVNFTIAKNLAAKAPAGTVFIGVCVDLGDLTAAKQAAATSQPPGEQIYDPMGFMGKFAGRAFLTTPGLVYAADRKGVLVSVSGQRDTTALLKSLANL